MTTAMPYPKVFAVRFRDLDRWDPSSFHRINWRWPKHVMSPIGSVLRLRKERVDRSAVQFSDLQPVTIHFDGSMDRRAVDGNREYSMDLWYARPGDVIVAKIDLKNGAVGIVPSDWTNVVVTGHFAVYEPDRSRLVPEYLHRVIQTTFFKQHLWRNKVGAEGRKEVKLDFFEQQPIPIPSLDVQRKIVDCWQSAVEVTKAATHREEQKRTNVMSRCFQHLGLHTADEDTLPKVFAILWPTATRWSVSYNQQVQAGMDLSHGRYPVVTLGSILTTVQYGTSQKANSDGRGTPILRMNNLVEGQLSLSDLKHIELPPRERDSLLLKDGDILINRTNSKELVGKCAVFHETGDFVFASYLIRLRVDPAKANPDYIAWAVNSPIGRQQIDAMSRQIIGQANINTEEIRSLEIPLPPLDVQRKIVTEVRAGLAEIAILRENARAQADAARAEVERMIIGAP
jgi:type I restriction enzyme S subunit